MTPIVALRHLPVRGAACESRADGTHYPGTYLAGVYNRLRSEAAGCRSHTGRAMASYG